MSKMVDLILVGQGIAGTTLAWNLVEAGKSFVILDREENVTSSRVAAGLMTPITGKRLVQTRGWQSYWKSAVEFYQRIEQRTNASFFFKKQMLRLFQSEDERALFNKKQSSLEDGVAINDVPVIPESLRNAELGGFEMQGGQLNVSCYLDASRRYFESIDSYRMLDLNFENDIELGSDGVFISKLNLIGDSVISCQGFQADVPKEFSSVKFNPSKGEILDVTIEGFREDRILHKGFWIAQSADGNYRIGANYNWQDFSTTTSEEGRRWITTRLEELLDRRYNVCEHKAAVRPTMHDFQPVVGMHPTIPRMGMFNGLGSKGSLMAPELARILIQHIWHNTPIPSEINLGRWYD